MTHGTGAASNITLSHWLHPRCPVNAFSKQTPAAFILCCIYSVRYSAITSLTNALTWSVRTFITILFLLLSFPHSCSLILSLSFSHMPTHTQSHTQNHRIVAWFFFPRTESLTLMKKRKKLEMFQIYDKILIRLMSKFLFLSFLDCCKSTGILYGIMIKGIDYMWYDELL